MHDIILLLPESSHKEIDSYDDQILEAMNHTKEVELHEKGSKEKRKRYRATEEIMPCLTEQTNLYAKRDKNQHSFTITAEGISQLLSLLFISGYQSLPKENDCWSTAKDMQAPIFSKTMIRDTFKLVKRKSAGDNREPLGTRVVKNMLSIIEELSQQVVFFDNSLWTFSRPFINEHQSMWDNQ
ncbi:hypothetical protein ILUMI_06927 [Ignelater luminosus]|uniref:PiggyBac transposable element-derived protein domain-containing protein n=1 Tax=Ignelater luminosus TaxID=2038154 RepID=A0A8K0GIJ7_IGNLU|nr:hypothetical protein ILUMI_06927 [Ignelater luminosus]